MSDLIMHIDMDAFFASVEQRVNPGLRGKPVIVGGRNNKYKSVVCAASYEAKAFGIDSGMPSWQALKLYPEAIFVPADSTKYLYTSKKIFEILKSFSPQVEMHSVDEFFLDINGCVKFFGSADAMALKIKAEIKKLFGITCSIGIAPSRLTAKLAAKMNKPDGLLILDKQKTLEILKNLPVEKLCGVGESLKQSLNRLGILTCGQLAEYPNYLLIGQFGKIGIWLKQASIGEDLGDVDYIEKTDAPPKSVGHSYTLRKITSDIEFIKGWLYLLCEMVAQRLRRLNLQGRTIHLYIYDGYKSGYSKQKTFAYATDDGYEIYRKSIYILGQLGIKQLKVRALGISVSGLCQESKIRLFTEQKKRDRLLSCLDKINDKFGDWTIFPATLEKTTSNEASNSLCGDSRQRKQHHKN